MKSSNTDLKAVAEYKFIRLFLILSLGILLFFSLIIGIIDPAFHFHAPLPGVSYVLNKERYQNNGIVRHFEYDALVTGTSMSENTDTSEVDNLFGVHSIKACFMGATYRELGDNIRVALKANPDLKMVMCTADISDLITDADAHVSSDPDSEYEYPAYLYDSNPFNDIEYLLNLKMLEYAANDLLLTIQGTPGTTFDEYANWSDKYVYGREAVLNSYVRPDSTETDKAFTDEDRAIVESNVRGNIIEIAQDHSETEFYIYVPPFSICYYDVEKRNGNLSRLLDGLEYEMTMLTEVPNIKMYCFLDRYDIVADLDLYKDRAHYCEDINSALLSCMKAGGGLITSDNYREYMQDVRSFYLNYDYDGLYR